RCHIYPVPNIKQPFLGVHYTLTADGKVKIGPTAIPALWRENYRLSRFSWTEFKEIIYCYGQLLLQNQFGFRKLVLQEVRKYFDFILKHEAKKLVLDDAHHYKKAFPGIRAQLFDLNKKQLEMDFSI